MGQSRSPHLARFLSDFTLGFSDGLTVPFALTAGLSSLGRTQTVIYAGLAELCAGSISMGIGGYLSALDDVRSSSSSSSSTSSARRVEELSEDMEERRGMLHDAEESPRASLGGEKSSSSNNNTTDEDVLRRYLGPLDLPSDVVSGIISSVGERQDGLGRAASRVRAQNGLSDGSETTSQEHQCAPIRPIVSGLSISMGYVIGGVIPLLPYCIASTVGVALCWSIGLCLLALFSFGFGKSWVMDQDQVCWRRCLWEGLRMLVLGSLAAAAAVICVNIVESSREPQG